MNKPDYKNWIPKWMITSGVIGVALSLILLVVFALVLHGTVKIILSVIFALLLSFMCVYLIWCLFANNRFSYDGERKLSKSIIDGIAEYINLPDDAVALDIGCGSGALSIAVAKKNPNAQIIGCDLWGKEYEFSRLLCKENARAEGVDNVKFQKGNATALPFEDGQFDAVMSNYVYHNIPSRDRQEILLETLRTLKKGGTFAIHDIFSKQKYGDMDAFVEHLYDMGYERVELIGTTDGEFMSSKEAKMMFLSESKLLVGKK